MRPPWISVAAEQGTRLQPAMPSFAGMCFQSVVMVPMNQWISSIGLIWIHNLTQQSRIVVSRTSETPCCDCAQKFNSYKGHRIICWTSRWNLESYERQDMSNDDSESSSTPGYDTFKSCFEQKVLHTQNSRFKQKLYPQRMSHIFKLLHSCESCKKLCAWQNDPKKGMWEV